MAFKLGDLIIDRIVEGIAEKSDGTLLYRLTNLQEATINITADSVDAVDGVGTVIKTFYRGKTGEFTATNSTISLPVIGAMSGTDAVEASAGSPIAMPRIVTSSTKTVVLPGVTGTSLATNKVVCHFVQENGTLGDRIADENLSLTAPSGEATASTLTITDSDSTHKAWIVKYERSVTANGIKIQNLSDKFPKTVKLTLKVLICDPCEPDTVLAAYVIIPSFQPSPELSVQFSTDATIDYTGRMQTSYCGKFLAA